MHCTSEKTALRATTLFACLYLLSGAFITSVGIYTMYHLPELFTTGSVIWTGIIISGLGVTALMLACCGTVSFRKGLVLVIIAAVILILCILNIVLLETVEWKYGIPPLSYEDPDEERRRNFLFFLTCLLSLFGTIIGLLTSLCNLIYAYCILLIPLKQLEKRRDIMKEKVKLHQSMKRRSPRGIPDGNTNSKPPTTTSSPDQPRSNSLPKCMPEKHHDWVYNHDISSELSISSEGTEMVANKAFLKDTLDTPILVNLSQDYPVSVTTSHCENKEVLEVVDSGYQWKQRADSSFRHDAVDEDPLQAKGLDVAQIGHSRERRISNFQLTTQDEVQEDMEDVNTVFNQLEKVLNASLSPEKSRSDASSKLEETVERNENDTQLEQEKQANSVIIDDLVAELTSTRL